MPRSKPPRRRTSTVALATDIDGRILFIRGLRVLLDSDLAVMYGVQTKVLNQSVSRNLARFPQDFMFRLSPQEKREVVTNCDHLRALRFSPGRPRAFTEQGVAMLSSVLRSPRGVQVNIEIMRAFVRIRRLLASHADLSKRLDELESRYDHQFKVVFDAIRALMEPPDEPDPPRRRIGFSAD